MTNAAANDKTIKELQEMAERASRMAPLQRARISRAALLESIDVLSRWSAAGLAVIAGASVYLAVFVGRDYPARAAAWTLMVLGALYFCRRLQNRFRTGAEISGHPFRWRQSFAACLCVLGVAFASAPILLTPLGAAPVIAAQTATLTLLAGVVAGVFFSAHLNSLAAVAAPAFAFPLLAAWRAGDAGAAAYAAIAAAIGAALLLTIHFAIARRLAARHPFIATRRSTVFKNNDQFHETGEEDAVSRYTA